MKIDWAGFASVLGVGVGVTVALVALFTLGVAGLAKQAPAGPGGQTASARRAGAYLCFALCTAAVAYGIWLIVG
ncbi:MULTISPECIES: hypothetical protein [Streptomycetaceae]|uniref:Uncharacterized protein n=1 Tax=Streptantibioticus cattleyicolor (strain ATCC 35852 / DSM 46488 / JCM 4925 / NBRC 14057 / NRRL 8057) TaxID=1003195 RepID=F8JY24_STREN|nr:hypothetical protein [Streptantibioticus cattleyicolor]AEW93410.1 hypothetical protein SCATT_10390 [Streptantibioticus cattleyicolor NRRL 8057 = DSM 46488]MYS58123.1 hypothetical protein [Streptomyces sp. SID5468]CCB73765.1 putative membrane protein [Streptantibioticus cattleyicolor NRRL 8057 = DSM 46488]